jgi:Sec-independent protein secretion pathway component TatC
MSPYTAQTVAEYIIRHERKALYAVAFMIGEQLTPDGVDFVTHLLVKWLKQMYQKYGTF